MNNSTCAIVVTYNRLTLLKEVIEALLNVEGQLDKIIVVNNASTDDTHKYLKSIESRFFKIEELLLNENVGGAGGFYHGLKNAYSEAYDYFWLMDDDSIVTPKSLKYLLKPFEDIVNVGFSCSKVLWKDMTPHVMNIPEVARQNQNGVAFFHDPGYINVSSCSFVSMLVSRQTVAEIGFPYKDFFIWCDDLEYTRRIIHYGFKGIFCEQSVVLHKTNTNYNNNIQNCSKEEFWKMKYGFRNRTFMHRNFKEYDLMFLNFIRNIVRALKRDHYKLSALSIVISSFVKGLTFKPRN